MNDSKSLNTSPKKRIVQKIDWYLTDKAKGTETGILAHAHTIANNMKVKGRIVRNKDQDLVVYLANHIDERDIGKPKPRRYDDTGFANSLEEQDWKDDLLDAYEIKMAKA